MKRLVILINFALLCGSAAAYEGFVPAGARGPGAAGTFFRTDLRVVNLSSASASVEVTFLPSGTDNSAAVPREVTIAGRSSLEVDDVLGSLFELEGGVGAFRIASEADLAVTSRTYTPSGDPECPGTFGQFIPALTSEQALERGVIPGVALSPDPALGFRSNVGAVNPADGPATVSLTLRTSDGAVLGTGSLALPPRGHLQASATSLFGPQTVQTTGAFIEVDATSPVLAYASVVDNQSGDPVFIPAQADSGTPSVLTIIAKQWVFEPETIEVAVGEPVTIQVRAIDVDHGISFSGVGPFTCTSEQFGQCILLPDETVTVTFTPRTRGSFAFFCTRFCGEAADGSHGHATMRGTLVVK